MMFGFRLYWLGSVPTEVGGFGWARLWVPMDGLAVGGYGSEVLVIEAFVVGSNVGVDDGDVEVGDKVGLFEEVGVAGGFEAKELRGASGVKVAESVGGGGGEMVGLKSGLTWIMKVLCLEVGVGEGVEAMGLSRFVVEVVVVVVGYGFVLNCVLGCGGCGGYVVVAVGCWQQCRGC